VIVYDALAEHADADERRALMKQHRWSLLFMGTIAGIFGAAPGLLWLGGVMAVMFLPVIAGFAIWLYVLVFVFRSVVPALLSGGAGTTAGSSIVCSCTISASRISTKERIWLSV
jgi:apolipoprotein N-acyltransferase